MPDPRFAFALAPLLAAALFQGEFPKSASEALGRKAETIAKAEIAEKESTRRGFAALDESRVLRELADAYDSIAALLAREEAFARSRDALAPRRADAAATIAKEESLRVRPSTASTARTEADLAALGAALDAEQQALAAIEARLAETERLASGGLLGERERWRALADGADLDRRSLQSGSSQLGPKAAAYEAERLDLEGALVKRALDLIDAREALAPTEIALLRAERQAKEMEIARRGREAAAAAAAVAEILEEERASLARAAEAIRSQLSRSGAPGEQAVLRLEAEAAEARVAAAESRAESHRSRVDPQLSTRVIAERARFENLRQELDARESSGHAAGFGEIFRAIAKTRNSKDVKDLEDERPRLRATIAQARARASAALRAVSDAEERRDEDRALLAGALGSMPEAERESWLSRSEKAAALWVDAQQAVALAASRLADLASARLGAIGRLVETLEEEQRLVRSRALFVRVEARLGPECVVQAARDGLQFARGAPAASATLLASARDFVGNRENLPRLLLAAVLLPGALVLVFVTRRVAVRLARGLASGGSLTMVERAQRLAIGLARRMALLGFLALAAMTAVRLFAAPAALVRAVDAAVLVVVLVRLAQAGVAALLRPDDARLRLWPVSDATARYVWRVALLATLSVLAIAIPRQVLEAVGYGGRNPEFLELLGFLQKALLVAAIVMLFARPAVLADLFPKSERPGWKVARAAVLRLRPFILFFAIAILGLRLLGYPFFAAYLESIALGGVAIAALASLGHRAAMDLWQRLAPGIRLGPGRGALDAEQRAFLDGVAKTVSAVAFAVAAYLALVAILRVGEEDLSAVNVGLGGRRFSIFDLVRFALALAATFVLAKWARQGLGLIVLPLLRLELGTRYAIAVTAGYLVIVVGLVVSLAQLGMELRDFAILLGAAGFGIGLGMQESASNFLNGLILLFSRPLKVGDVIESEGRLGTVQEITITTTILQTAENFEIRIPNREIVGKRLVNHTGRDPKVRAACAVSLAYGCDVEKAKGVLLEAVRLVAGVRERPAPEVAVLSFGPSAVEVEVRYWAHVNERPELETRVRSAVLPALHAAGFEVPFPRQDIRFAGPIDVRRV